MLVNFQNSEISQLVQPNLKQNKLAKMDYKSKDVNLNSMPNAIYNVAFCAKANITPTKLERFEGCLLGGAIGDAFGAPLEFKSINEIKKIYGKFGLTDLKMNINSGVAEVTDDTQMTIFTINGLLSGLPVHFNSNKKINTNAVLDSYKQWYRTQINPYEYIDNCSWIYNIEELHARKYPGDTCMSALSRDIKGTVKKPINNSKGNGCVMRIAPVGLLYYKNPDMAFEIGKDIAALTHGHPTGYLSGGCMAYIIAHLTNGYSIYEAVDKAMHYLKENYSEAITKDILEKIELAKSLALSSKHSSDEIKYMGNGSTADEALGSALYCVMREPKDFKKALMLSVNHSGDSDTIGAISGNLLGCMCGISTIPRNWRDIIQFKTLLSTLANDLYDATYKSSELIKKYPFYKNRMPKWYNNSSSPEGQQIRKLPKVHFSEKDEIIMRKMPVQDRIKYKQQLIEQNRYTI